MSDALSNAFSAWPSFIITGAMVILWAGHVRATGREYRRDPTHARFRVYVVAWTVMVVVVALALQIVVAWTLPSGRISVWTIGFVSMARSVLLIVGAWLTWDRHRRP